MNKVQDEREAFEAASSRGAWFVRAGRIRDGKWTYDDRITNIAWVTWQRARFDRPAQTEQSLKELDSLMTVEEHERMVAKGQELNQQYIARLEAQLARTEQQPSATQQILDLIMEQCRYWHGRDEARRGGFACLYAAAKELADNAAPIEQTEQQPEQSGCVPEDICRRLLFAFGLECNSIGLQGAAENLHKGMKAATSALPATPSPAMDAKEG